MLRKIQSTVTSNYKTICSSVFISSSITYLLTAPKITTTEEKPSKINEESFERRAYEILQTIENTSIRSINNVLIEIKPFFYLALFSCILSIYSLIQAFIKY
jgi:hypothetical protein